MSKKKYRIEYDRAGCIGAVICETMNPENFEMADDGKANLIDGKEHEERKNWFVKEVNLDMDDPEDKEQFDKLRRAAEGCPVNVIHIIDLEEDKKLI